MDSGQGERLIKVLTQIKDRLPAATAPTAAPAFKELTMEAFEKAGRITMVAWLTPENQVAWVKKGMIPGNGCRPLYVRDAS